MNFLRALVASFLSLICSVAVGAFVILATLQATVLNRNEVKTWAQNSGVYQTALQGTISEDAAIQQQLEASSIPTETLTTAINQTFPPSYVQQSTETVIDSTYDWLGGKTNAISFDINTTVKKDEFTRNLSTALEPQIAALPRCATLAEFSASSPTCVPPGYTAKQLADSLATDAGNSLAIFHEPITNETISKVLPRSQAKPSATTNEAPQIVSNIDTWVWILPIIAVVSGGLMVILTRNKLIAAKRLAGKLTCSLAFTTIIGVIIATVSKSLRLSDYLSGGAAQRTVIEPILQQAALAIGNRLAWVSGISGLIMFALWITLLTVKKRRTRTSTATTTLPETPNPPINTPPEVK